MGALTLLATVALGGEPGEEASETLDLAPIPAGAGQQRIKAPAV
jgi:hypothetical protein